MCSRLPPCKMQARRCQGVARATTPPRPAAATRASGSNDTRLAPLRRFALCAFCLLPIPASLREETGRGGKKVGSGGGGAERGGKCVDSTRLDVPKDGQAPPWPAVPCQARTAAMAAMAASPRRALGAKNKRARLASPRLARSVSTRRRHARPAPPRQLFPVPSPALDAVGGEARADRKFLLPDDKTTKKKEVVYSFYFSSHARRAASLCFCFRARYRRATVSPAQGQR